MNSSSETSSAADPYPETFPEHLPPVKPPSVAFITQLFIVPGIIVLMIVAGYTLLGRLVVDQDDWQQRVADLQNPNPHVRWRGGIGLADLLAADERLGDQGQRLAENRDLATAITTALADEIKQEQNPSDDHLTYQGYLCRALGMFRLPDVVVPALVDAAQPNRHRELRKNALSAIAVMQNLAVEKKQPINDPTVLPLVIAVSREEDTLLRQLSAFTLGLFPEKAAMDRLEVLLEDADPNTRLNAAVALARLNDSRCLPVLMKALENPNETFAPQGPEEFEQYVRLKNVLSAIERIAPRCTADQKTELIRLVEPFAEGFREKAVIQVTAQTAITALRTAAPQGAPPAATAADSDSAK